MSRFDGTWRPDPQQPGPDAPTDEVLLAGGWYADLTASPPYRIPADGVAHPVDGQSSFDALAVTVVDDRTVRRVASRGGTPVVEATTVLSPFGQTKRETQRHLAMANVPFEFAITSRRVEAGPDGSHALSGRWQRVEADLPNHEEDTTYAIVGHMFSMRDGFGRSFDAPLDGTVVPYHGDARFTTVSCRRLDDATIEEVDRHDADVVLTTTWRVEADGRTMHVRFEYADGRVQEQDGHRLD